MNIITIQVIIVPLPANLSASPLLNLPACLSNSCSLFAAVYLVVYTYILVKSVKPDTYIVYTRRTTQLHKYTYPYIIIPYNSDRKSCLRD